MEERDKYLTEAMGECWHEFTLDDPHLKPVEGSYGICNCGYRINYLHFHAHTKYNPKFSTWDGFGKLYEWSVEQDWWYEFLFEWSGEIISFSIPYKLVYPNPFANVIYEFLRDKETSSESSNISG